MDESPKKWLAGYSFSACILKFIGAFIFGLFVDICVLALVFLTAGESVRSNRGIAPWRITENLLGSSAFWWLLVIIPIAWGILGIFKFEKMLDLGRNFWEMIFRSRM